ncbi:hypothetical protein [Dyadobacter sp. SG02]|uniref:hypothetical protein n=1 Tax=Dyadobacter sp. SG02 TaxID=1855291 RepID=UPI0015A5A14C|nr:hypothetical protein [Dyadobacter sp. SG02]
MSHNSDLVISPKQRKSIEDKFREADEFAKNIDFDNLPKRENHPEVSRPAAKGSHQGKA